jgi:hypothetical protein
VLQLMQGEIQEYPEIDCPMAEHAVTRMLHPDPGTRITTEGLRAHPVVRGADRYLADAFSIFGNLYGNVAPSTEHQKKKTVVENLGRKTELTALLASTTTIEVCWFSMHLLPGSYCGP